MTLAIYCAGGLGKEIVALARSVTRWQYIIFVDDVTEDEWYEGAKVYKFDEIADLPDEVEFVIANGEPSSREAIYKKIKSAGYKLTTIIGLGATIHPSAKLGEGCILYDCGVSADTVIGDNVLINTRVVIGHDVKVASHVVISALCFIGGLTSIGERTYLAPGAMVKDRVHIGSDVIISLGGVVLRSVRDFSIMVGNPAKKIADNIDKKIFNLF